MDCLEYIIGQQILIILSSFLFCSESDDLDGVWMKPKFLQCPASFTVNMLSKFIVMKIGMDANKFLVSNISCIPRRKVLTITLLHYTGGHLVQSQDYRVSGLLYSNGCRLHLHMEKGKQTFHPPTQISLFSQHARTCLHFIMTLTHIPLSPLLLSHHQQEAPMRFFFSVRTKETSHQELPEVPFRRSPGISSNPALPPLLVDSQNSALVNSGSLPPTSDKPAVPSGPSAVVGVVETKLKLVKKVDDSASPRVSDKKRVVYMVQSAQADNGPQISADAAYSLLPHESTAVGVNSTPALASPLANGSASKSAKQQQQQPKEKTAEEGTPRYRSLVEKENAKMKKLMQSLSEEKKLLKLRKREAMKEAASTSSSSSPNTSLKMKITKSDSGLLVVQSSVEEPPKDVLSVIDSVANCDVNDTHKKSLFLQAFELAPKKASVPEKEQLKVS